MQKSRKLVVLGSINVDHILNVTDFPRAGETVTGQQYQLAFGGKGANQAVAAARSGAKTHFIACVGDDELGNKIRQQLQQDHVDIQAVEVMPATNTGVALIFVNQQGENRIGIEAGANAALTPEQLEKHQAVLLCADVLLMQLEIPLATVQHAAALAKKHNLKVVVNPAPAAVLPDSLLAQIDMITPNETEAEILTGIAVTDVPSAQRAAEWLHQKGIATVIITLGSKGAWVSEQGAGELMAGYRVEAIDTIAAGDTFNGALMTALQEGNSLHDAVKFAHAAAALAVTRRGGQPSVPWREEIRQFLSEQV